MFKMLSLERTVCYGECPIYKVVVFANGEVNWNGEGYVSLTGKHQWQLSDMKVKKLARLIDDFQFRYFEYRTTGMTATDHPFCNVSVEFSDGYVHDVEHYLGDELEDKSLNRFEKAVDRILGTDKLKGLV